MQPFQQRVITERDELEDKIDKLVPFLDGPTFKTLPESEQSRLRRQLVVMHDYLHILNARIDAF